MNRFFRAVEIGQVRKDDSQVKRGNKLQWEWYCGNKIDVGNFLERYFDLMCTRRQSRALDLMVHIETRNRLHSK